MPFLAFVKSIVAPCRELLKQAKNVKKYKDLLKSQDVFITQPETFFNFLNKYCVSPYGPISIKKRGSYEKK